MAQRRPPLTVEQILAWADAHHARVGRWPRAASGPVPGAPGVSWLDIDRALKWGRRGLPPGSTLAEFLHANGRCRGAAGG
jgi:hypothetical protein